MHEILTTSPVPESVIAQERQRAAQEHFRDLQAGEEAIPARADRTRTKGLIPEASKPLGWGATCVCGQGTGFLPAPVLPDGWLELKRFGGLVTVYRCPECAAAEEVRLVQTSKVRIVERRPGFGPIFEYARQCLVCADWFFLGPSGYAVPLGAGCVCARCRTEVLAR